MKSHLQSVAAAAVAVILAAAPGVSLAQSDASPYTRDNVLPADPFGGIPVDPTNLEINYAARLIVGLSAENLLELNQRCDVVISGPFRYGVPNVAFCQRVYYEQGILPYPADASSAAEDEGSEASESSEASSTSSSSGGSSESGSTGSSSSSE